MHGCVENGTQRPLENEDLENKGPLENKDPFENEELEDEDPLEIICEVKGKWHNASVGHVLIVSS